MALFVHQLTVLGRFRQNEVPFVFKECKIHLIVYAKVSFVVLFLMTVALYGAAVISHRNVHLKSQEVQRKSRLYAFSIIQHFFNKRFSNF